MLVALLILLLAGLAVVAYRMVSGMPISAASRRNVGPVLCGILGHHREKASVRKTDRGYQARCSRCDARLVKANRQDEWHADPIVLPATPPQT